MFRGQEAFNHQFFHQPFSCLLPFCSCWHCVLLFYFCFFQETFKSLVCETQELTLCCHPELNPIKINSPVKLMAACAARCLCFALLRLNAFIEARIVSQENILKNWSFQQPSPCQGKHFHSHYLLKQKSFQTVRLFFFFSKFLNIRTSQNGM